MVIIGSNLLAKFYKTIILPKIMFVFGYKCELKVRNYKKHDLYLTYRKSDNTHIILK